MVIVSLLSQIALWSAAVYLLLVLFMYLRQDRFIFFPTKRLHSGPGVEHAEEFTVEHEGLLLRGWLLNPLYASEKVLIYYGGNSEDILLGSDEFSALQAAVLLMPYRGFSGNPGRPGEQELVSDARAILRELRSRFAPRRIFVMGRSLGAAVACQMAATATREPLAGLIMVTPFDSLVTVAREIYPWLPVGRLLQHRFESDLYAPGINCPVLVIYGEGDQVVRPELTRKLIGLLPAASREVLSIERADHQNIDMFPQYWQRLIAFLNIREDAAS